MIRPSLLMLAPLLLTACARPGGPYPSLAPRAAETVDPRLPVEAGGDPAPASAALVARLDALVAEARAGDAAFAQAAAAAEARVAAAGARESESWIVAQQALSAAVAARARTASALADLDAIGAEAIGRTGGIAPGDLAAIRAAAAEAAEIDRRQEARVDAMRARLSR